MNGSVGKAFLNSAKVTLESATDTRDYKVFVDGRDFDANGTHFANDESFALELSNDSASKCVVCCSRNCRYLFGTADEP